MLAKVPGDWDGANMISERTFARSFSGFWSELLPLLTPTYVHVINESFKEHLLDDRGLPLEIVVKNSESADSAVMAEFAFFLAKIAVENGLRVDQTFQNKDFRASAEQNAEDAVERYESRGGYIPTTITRIDQQEALSLAHNYERFFRQRPCSGEKIEFCPEIPGAGFIFSCRADISIGHTLFEVKTVNRNLAGKDIRQLVVYLALQAVTGERRWSRAGFFNPRRAIYQEFGVDDVITRMSGGRSSVEVFQELVDFVCSRDIQLDMAF